MKRLLLGFLKCRNATSAIEFAILALPMFMLLFGSVEAGRAYWTSQAVKDVATSVARCIGVASPECVKDGAFDKEQTLSYAMTSARSFGVPLLKNSVTIMENAECAGVGGFAVVTVSHRFSSPVGLLGDMFTDGIVFKRRSCYPVTAAS